MVFLFHPPLLSFIYILFGLICYSHYYLLSHRTSFATMVLIEMLVGGVIGHKVMKHRNQRRQNKEVQGGYDQQQSMYNYPPQVGHQPSSTIMWSRAH